MKLELSTRINAISANKCKCCNKKDKDLRFGFCFDCAEAESIIANGLDMDDEKLPKEEGFSPHMMKVKHLIKKGWKISNSLK